jgi:CheY-like chemotaxis protein
VLIIDDQPEVRGVMVRVLVQAGYSVEGVADGMEALDALGKRRFKAIICDLKLPFVGGEEFYTQLRATMPDLAERVLFITGASDVASKRFIARSGRPVLQKPYELRDMLRIISELVGRPPAPGVAL